MQERLGRKGYRKLAENGWYRSAARGLTFTWFAFTLFWFWSNWSQIGGFVSACGPAALVVVWLAIFVAATILLTAGEALRNACSHLTWRNTQLVSSRYVRTVVDTAILVVTITIIVLLNSPAPDIVYKTF